MPIYEFKCEKCQRLAEVFADRVPGPETIDCTEPTFRCEGKMKRILSQSSFILKGSGWARDGYK